MRPRLVGKCIQDIFTRPCCGLQQTELFQSYCSAITSLTLQKCNLDGEKEDWRRRCQIAMGKMLKHKKVGKSTFKNSLSFINKMHKKTPL